MKKILCGAYNVLRYIIILSALWLVVDTIYLRITGDYILYYNTLLFAAENVIEQISIIHEVFNVRADKLAIIITDYYYPVVRAVSVILVMLKTVSVFDSHTNYKKTAIRYAVDLLSMLVILCITLGLITVI